MSEAVMACGVALSGVFLSLMLHELGYRGARLLSVAAVLTLIMLSLGVVSDVFSALEPIIDAGGISDAAECATKIIGIGYLTGVCRDISLDMGQQAVASALSTVGRVEIMLVVMPFITEIVQMAIDMM